jgi:hypothetical protein
MEIHQAGKAYVKNPVDTVAGIQKQWGTFYVFILYHLSASLNFELRRVIRRHFRATRADSLLPA